MNEALTAAVLSAFVVFCRVGACLMIMPGLSSQRVPVRARLFIAIALSLAFLPLLNERFADLMKPAALSALIRVIVTELLIGLMIGLLARLFFLMLEMMASAIATSIGLAGIAGMPMEESEAAPPIVTLITLSAVLLFFLADLHLEVLRGLFLSYDALPPGSGLPARFSLTEVADALTEASLLALRISSPFLVLSLALNFAFGLANKMTPTIQVYFASMPFLIAGGLLLLMTLGKPLFQGFLIGFQQFVVR
ncbi:MAG: flagellar biosynthetic protein FliR [Hyphomicrobiales bacterium]|jgi:flagellar biosynthetic protein FliR|nr:flagellar biosynthetic protein FliR [Hyphomicrobiales bacterium]